MGEIAIRRILASTDFSASSNLALDYAVELARAFGARLILLHVVEADFEAGALSYGLQPTLAEYVEKTKQVAMERLEAAASRVADLDVEILLKRGTASVEIVRTAIEDACDVIVIGTRGQSALRHMLFGSTAERVLRKATCPVLAVPGEIPEGDDSTPGAGGG